MKRRLIILITGLFAVIVLGFIAVCSWIDYDIKENISIAQERYPGNAEDALIAYLLDTTNSPRNRSALAIWTLGQIKSKKALPVLQDLYKNDPKGETCHGNHDYVLCQYEIHKAMNAVNANRWPKHARLNK